MGVCVLNLFLAVPWVGLWSIILAFPCHIRLFYKGEKKQQHILSSLHFSTCVVAVCVLHLFLTVHLFGLQYFIIAFPGNTLAFSETVKIPFNHLPFISTAALLVA